MKISPGMQLMLLGLAGGAVVALAVWKRSPILLAVGVGAQAIASYQGIRRGLLERPA